MTLFRYAEIEVDFEMIFANNMDFLARHSIVRKYSMNDPLHFARIVNANPIKQSHPYAPPHPLKILGRTPHDQLRRRHCPFPCEGPPPHLPIGIRSARDLLGLQSGLQGVALDREVKLDVTRVEDEPSGANATAPAWRGANAIQPVGTSLKFILPADLAPGIFAVRVTGKGGSTETLLNAPDCWWLQGDHGYAKAAPGGWLRIFGRSLNLGDKASKVILRSESGVETNAEIPAAKSDGYCLTLPLSETLPTGKYSVRLHNGHGGGPGKLWTKWSGRRKSMTSPPLVSARTTGWTMRPEFRPHWTRQAGTGAG